MHYEITRIKQVSYHWNYNYSINPLCSIWNYYNSLSLYQIPGKIFKIFATTEFLNNTFRLKIIFHVIILKYMLSNLYVILNQIFSDA